MVEQYDTKTVSLLKILLAIAVMGILVFVVAGSIYASSAQSNHLHLNKNKGFD